MFIFFLKIEKKKNLFINACFCSIKHGSKGICGISHTIFNEFSIVRHLQFNTLYIAKYGSDFHSVKKFEKSML